MQNLIPCAEITKELEITHAPAEIVKESGDLPVPARPLKIKEQQCLKILPRQSAVGNFLKVHAVDSKLGQRAVKTAGSVRNSECHGNRVSVRRRKEILGKADEPGKIGINVRSVFLHNRKTVHLSAPL